MQGALDGCRDSRGKRDGNRYQSPPGCGSGRIIDPRDGRLRGQGKVHRRHAEGGLRAVAEALRRGRVPGRHLDRRRAGDRYRDRGDEGASVRRSEIHGFHRRLRQGDVWAVCGNEGHHHDALRGRHPGRQFHDPAGVRQCGGGGLRHGQKFTGT